ncbi:MAG: helix-turn-helix domain-containing protein [Rhodoplanes sp.]|uniref:helix-turn-helix domain-containing protein n=1 Tax=Rhodoplanes sp. TaxID=1968906 RepID=UPI001808937C|nr:helix-turn-helix domain-containing protein [Rhodoplanes sp.]NVO16105.1 helix-turn-helix domain-containing protein [Rhodoplanes sp.]
MSEWVDLTDVALHAQVTPQRLRYIATHPRTSAAARWHGVVVRRVPGPYGGGQSGIRYEFYLPSLPADIQASLKAVQPASEPASNRRDDRSVVGHWRLHLITPALGLDKRTSERSVAVREIARTTRIGPDGRPITVTERTIERWLDAYEADGIAGLMQRARRDKGSARVVISQVWFAKARVWLDTTTIARIDDELRAYVRSMHAAGESPGRIIFRAGMKLRELSAAAGMPVDEMNKAVFAVPRIYVVRERLWRKVATRDRDAKAWHDMRPSMLRKLADRPTEFDLDAMHFDHTVCRVDGTVAYPKAIVAMCRATNRLLVVPFLLDQREGLRQEHVALFIETLFDQWGTPDRLTIDNGGEFGAVPDLADLLQIVAQVHSADGRRPVVHAQPYNARAKVVENGIGVLQRVWLAGLPGHVGNNRINKKTQKVGRPTTPFPGGFDLFCQIVQMRVCEYNAAPQRGKLKGRSPDEVYQSHIDAGFTVAKVDRASLMLAFSTRDIASVGKFGIRVNGRYWTCDALRYRSGEKIGVLKGRFHDWPVVPLYDLDDERTIIGYADPNEAVDGTDPENARKQKRAERRFKSRARDLANVASPADLVADTIASAATLPPPIQAPVDGIIVPNPQAAEIVAAMAVPPEERASRHTRKVHAEIERELAKSEKFHRLLLGGKS